MQVYSTNQGEESQYNRMRVLLDKRMGFTYNNCGYHIVVKSASFCLYQPDDTLEHSKQMPTGIKQNKT